MSTESLQIFQNRIVENLIRKKLETNSIIQIVGPKGAGKTTLAKEFAKSYVALNEDEKSASYNALAENQPSLILKGEKPKVFDDWILAPNILKAIKKSLGGKELQEKYILVSDIEKEEEGVENVHLLPMTMSEAQDSLGVISLKKLFENPNDDFYAANTLTLENLAYVICRGGWPEALTLEKRFAKKVAKEFLTDVIQTEISRIDKVKRDPFRAELILKVIANHLMTTVDTKEILTRVLENGKSITYPTYYSYYKNFERCNLIKDIPPWKPKLTKKTFIRSAVKRQFVDPSIAVNLLKLDEKTILENKKIFSQLFKSLSARDIFVFSEGLNAKLFHYRDGSNLDIDLILEREDKTWAAIEIEVEAKGVEKAVLKLHKLYKKVDRKEMGNPAFMMVVTAGEYAYRRPDGIFVIPLSCLCP